jgi:hypothetical protein
MQELLSRGDPLSYAARVRDRGVHTFFVAAHNDETVPNQAGEALAAALGLSWVKGLPATTPAPAWVDPAVLPEATAPFAGNQSTLAGPRTAGFVEFEPAMHVMLTLRTWLSQWQPPFPPFVAQVPAVRISNPTDELQELLANFSSSYFTGPLPRVAQ